MTDPVASGASPLTALLAAAAAETRFPPNSRYRGVATATHTAADGRSVPYLLRRFPPRPGSLTTLGIHAVGEGERLDHVAAQHFGDPELFWRVCDANAALHPEDLERPGAELRIASPGGPLGGAAGGGSLG